MFERPEHANIRLEPIEIRILKLLKPKSQTEKQIAKILQVDPLVLSSLITELILKGYLQTFRRRRLYFFSREVCSITPEGISAIENSSTPFQSLVETIREKAAEALDNLLAGSPALRIAASSARTLYRVAKAIS